ncbi:CoA ester lyase [Paracoccus sp. Z118]|uniref:HpcH/HpaI aldolase/citrate lyase family protein n=1 Tax=Paracoccus sp. Z118 TaxID=2851017 RepID=UPI001C2B99C0|nr:CoA ester lyase [Paracoccus sp. Z118]MBV0892068.1 CoA ester lyase [Paracoccus sp. Z118]
MRSFLFVPGDSARKFERAREGAADALILDLEDSVAAGQKDAAREITATMLSAERGPQALFVRVNALDTGRTLGDLAAVMPLRPDGIVLPKCASAADVARLSNYLDAFETAAGHETGATRIVGVATETAESIWNLGGYKGASPRLWGIMWGGEDLAASLGATENNVDGAFTSPFMLARNLCLMGAAAAGIVAIDTVSTRIKDLEHVEAEARAARRDGFGAKAVIHPTHVEIVNRAFTPTEAEAAWAQRVAAAFRDDPEAGVVTIDGRMIDKPHERAAQKILAALRR